MNFYLVNYSKLLDCPCLFSSSPDICKIPEIFDINQPRIGFPGGASGKEPSWECRRYKRCRFNPQFRNIPWISEGQCTPVFLLGEFHGQRNLVGYSPWGLTESDMTECAYARERTHTHTHTQLYISFMFSSLFGKYKTQFIFKYLIFVRV